MGKLEGERRRNEQEEFYWNLHLGSVTKNFIRIMIYSKIPGRVIRFQHIENINACLDGNVKYSDSPLYIL